VPLVGWARLVLRAHTLAQVLAGFAVGAGVTTAVLLLAGVR
jgi:membrane-associated phospholipid phosphatase